MDQEEEESIQSRRNVVTSLIISTHLNRFSFLSFICLHVLFLFLFFFFFNFHLLKEKEKNKRKRRMRTQRLARWSNGIKLYENIL